MINYCDLQSRNCYDIKLIDWSILCHINLIVTTWETDEQMQKQNNAKHQYGNNSKRGLIIQIEYNMPYDYS